MTEMVQMMVSGRLALVPANKAEMIAKKQELVAEASALQKYYEADKDSHAYALPMLQKKVEQIIRLKRRIGPCVRFI